MSDERGTEPRTRERLRPGDLTQLASDVGPVPMNVGVLLRLGPGAAADDVVAALCSRLGTVERLRQRLTDPAPWRRRSWVHDPTSDPAVHVSSVCCPDPDDLDAVLRVGADAVTTPLPRDRPLWRAVVVERPDRTACAVVVVLHHVVADGVAGVALLARVLDGSRYPVERSGPGAEADPQDRPVQGTQGRSTAARAAARAADAVRGVRRGAAELGLFGSRPRSAPRTSLNVATGARRHVVTVDVDLGAVRSAARRHAATVNDVLLVASTGALARLLAVRGETLSELVVSLPVAARARRPDGDLGNDVGVMALRVPVTGTSVDRLRQVARVTRTRKAGVPGASSSLVGPVFRLLVALRLFRPLVDRQRLVNTFVTNVRGPRTAGTLAGAPVTGAVPITATARNVTVAFAALSLAGTLTISVIVDPDRVPETALLVSALADELRALTDVAAVAAPGATEGTS